MGELDGKFESHEELIKRVYNIALDEEHPECNKARKLLNKMIKKLGLPIGTFKMVEEKWRIA